MKHLFINTLLLIGLLSGPKNPAVSALQSSVVFRNVTVESNFPDGITFRIEICGRPVSSRAVFNYSISSASQNGIWNKKVWTLDEGQTADNCDKRKFFFETKDLEIPPFSPIRYFWSVNEGTKIAAKSSSYIYYYRDGNYDWKNLEDEKLVIWWHNRPDSFGQEVMSIASTAFRDQAEYYSISLDAPIVIVITNTPEEFFSWQDEKDYVGGMAFPELNLTVQLVEDDVDYHDWLSDVIPHEISHVFYNHLMKRYFGAPYWLDEGMATYQEYNDHYEEWNSVRDAFETNHILSLKDLESGFGENEDDVELAYAESYYAVLYMNESYGRDATSTLLVEFSRGSAEDTAFLKAFGSDSAEFEADYMVWLEKRIETLPPNTVIQTPLSERETNLLFFSLMGLCSLPLCFVVSGGGILFLLWKLNNKSSASTETTISS